MDVAVVRNNYFERPVHSVTPTRREVANLLPHMAATLCQLQSLENETLAIRALMANGFGPLEVALLAPEALEIARRMPALAPIARRPSIPFYAMKRPERRP